MMKEPITLLMSTITSTNVLQPMELLAPNLPSVFKWYSLASVMDSGDLDVRFD